MRGVSRRFIPTGVGNGLWDRLRGGAGAVHPHRRGERPNDIHVVGAEAGSSPQAWGTAGPPRRGLPYSRFIPTGVGNGDPRALVVEVRRFIPTGVGNGGRLRGPMGLISVHPHRRGERFKITDMVNEASGSSPQAWGTVTPPVLLPLHLRFIPTGVGNGAGQLPTTF